MLTYCFLPIAAVTALTIFSGPNPYFFNRSSGFPLSPKLSFTATISIGAGWC